MSRLLFGIGAGVLAFLFAFFGWKYFISPADAHHPLSGSIAASSGSDTEAGRTPPLGSSIYHDTRYHFELFYPGELSVKTYEDKGSASTITFENEKQGTGFQIFVAPYAEAQISAERFRLDAPSGVREEMTTVSVDGATGAAFYSKDAALGDTREIWFIKAGLLYEVTAPKQASDWLQGIIDTWKFI